MILLLKGYFSWSGINFIIIKSLIFYFYEQKHSVKIKVFKSYFVFLTPSLGAQGDALNEIISILRTDFIFLTEKWTAY